MSRTAECLIFPEKARERENLLERQDGSLESRSPWNPGNRKL
jgi:hypothetical protein